jgi:hypothetical protein
MKNTLITLTAAALLSMGTIAIADEPTQGPIAMADAEMDQVVAGNRSLAHKAYILAEPGSPQGEIVLINYAYFLDEAEHQNPGQGADVNYTPDPCIQLC